jgi:xanthine dehydrogenase accessory factor
VDVFDALAKARGRGQRVALVTVLAVAGEPPTEPGAKLVVAEAQGGEPPAAAADEPPVLAGTLGCAEFDTVGRQLAAEAFGQDQPLRRDVDVGEPGTDWTLELFVEVHLPEPALLVLGASPVGRALANLAATTGRRAVLVAPGGDVGVAAGVEAKADAPERYLLAAPPGPADAVVLADHDAPWVDEALRVALAAGVSYVGMLGSRRHAPQAVRRLRGAGVPESHIARLHSPCGLDIGAQTPGEIALSILSQVVATEHGCAGGPLGLDWSTAPT